MAKRRVGLVLARELSSCRALSLVRSFLSHLPLCTFSRPTATAYTLLFLFSLVPLHG